MKANESCDRCGGPFGWSAYQGTPIRTKSLGISILPGDHKVCGPCSLEYENWLRKFVDRYGRFKPGVTEIPVMEFMNVPPKYPRSDQYRSRLSKVRERRSSIETTDE